MKNPATNLSTGIDYNQYNNLETEKSQSTTEFPETAPYELGPV